jgi:hypothetical protein
MKSFKDAEGQTWNLSLTLGKVRQLREKLGLDLLNPSHYLQILNSLTDRLAFCFLLVEDQAKVIGVDADSFEERLYGPGVSIAASHAFLEETQNFFQKLGQTSMEALARKSIESMKSGQARIDEMISTGQFDSMLDKAEEEIQKLLLPSGGNGLPSSQPSPV